MQLLQNFILMYLPPKLMLRPKEDLFQIMVSIYRVINNGHFLISSYSELTKDSKFYEKDMTFKHFLKPSIDPSFTTGVSASNYRMMHMGFRVVCH